MSGTEPKQAEAGKLAGGALVFTGTSGDAPKTGPHRTSPVPPAATGDSQEAFRILHVEDDPFVGRLMREILLKSEQPRFAVQTAESLASGLDRLATSPVDVLLLDLSLPDSRGLDTVTRVRSQFHHVPIVVLSGHDDERMALAALKLGAQDYLVKGTANAQIIIRSIRYAMERKRSDDALARERDLLHGLLNNIPDRIYFKDAASRFLRVNRAMADKFGLATPEAAVGKTDFDFHPTQDAEEFFADEQRLLQSGEAIINKVEAQTATDGSPMWASVTKVPMRDRHGHIAGLIGISRDITELRQASQQLETANEGLQRANAALKLVQSQLIDAERLQSVGRLAAGVAHEVKNPLAVLRMGVDYFLSLPLPPESAGTAGGVLEDMQSAIKRADTIIMGMLTFSTPGELKLKPVDLNHLVNHSLSLVRHELISNGYVVERQVTPGAARALLDAQKIDQVLVNLLTNAFHAMPGGGKLTLRTGVRAIAAEETGHDAGSREGARFHTGEEVVEVQIDDTGCGIPPDKLGKIFEPFFTTKETGKGTGLGLTVARKIVELHGGSLEINNRPEGGVRSTLLFKAIKESP